MLETTNLRINLFFPILIYAYTFVPKYKQKLIKKINVFDLRDTSTYVDPILFTF